ncbi:MAG TPA: Mut7-C RNAse domain-containing protein [Gallionella sp.]|nr:Mut7-C RNAse domain-containing protein [Gallionella sp.]
MSQPSFLCDEMLGHLCRYLRAAGYDTLLANDSASDADLLRQCSEEGRYFLTQDTLVREHKAACGIALILPHAPLDRLAELVDARFHLDWLEHAFTRCLIDNTPLVQADEAATARIPDDARHPDQPLLHCPKCGRVYWRGSHYKRMHARLEAWQQKKG